MIATTEPLVAARSAALFVSTLSATAHPTDAEVAAAIRDSLRTHGGTRGCAAEVAATYGDYPELAARRMCWARGVIANLYARRVPPNARNRTGPAGTERHRTTRQQRLATAA